MVRLTGILAAAAALAVLASAAQGQRPAAKGQTPAVRPHIQIDSISNEQFRALLSTLRFAVDTEAGDRQALMIGRYPDSARLGPVATILPEEHAYTRSREQLERGEIIAAIGNEGADSYPKLGLLPHATTYWWVEYNERTERGRSVFVAVDSNRNIVAKAYRGLEITKTHRRYRAMQPLARFVWTSGDDLAWGWCGSYCCKSTPQILPR